MKSILLLTLFPVLASTKAATSLTSAVNVLSEAINKLESEQQRISFNAVLKKIKVEEGISPENIKILDEINVMLNDVLGTLQLSATVHQSILDEVHDEVHRCNNHDLDTDQEKVEAMEDAADAHQTCRGQEKLLFDDSATKCNSLTNWLQVTPNGLNCVWPMVDKSTIEQWDTDLENARDFFIDNEPVYEGLRDACVDADAAYVAKKDLCDTDQHTFENDYCQMKSFRIQRCSILDGCHDGAGDVHQNNTDVLVPLGDLRARQAAMIDNIQCLTGKLIEGVQVGDRPQDICPFVEANDPKFDIYRVVSPDLPGKDACHANDFANSPGSADFNNQHYSWLQTGLSLAPTNNPC